MAHAGVTQAPGPDPRPWASAEVAGAEAGPHGAEVLAGARMAVSAAAWARLQLLPRCGRHSPSVAPRLWEAEVVVVVVSGVSGSASSEDEDSSWDLWSSWRCGSAGNYRISKYFTYRYVRAYVCERSSQSANPNSYEYRWACYCVMSRTHGGNSTPAFPSHDAPAALPVPVAAPLAWGNSQVQGVQVLLERTGWVVGRHALPECGVPVILRANAIVKMLSASETDAACKPAQAEERQAVQLSA